MTLTLVRPTSALTLRPTPRTTSRILVPRHLPTPDVAARTTTALAEARLEAPIRRPTIVASAANVAINDSSATDFRRTRQFWQRDAWFFFRKIGEAGYANLLVANALSRLKLLPAIRTRPGHDPELIDDANSIQQAILDNLGTGFQGQTRTLGHPGLMYSLGMQLQVPGELYWYGTVDPNTGANVWEVLSITELEPMGPGNFQIRRLPGVLPTPINPATDLIRRVWNPDPELKTLAWSPMGACLDILEELWIRTDSGISSAKSRLASLGGILGVPDELDYEGTEGPDGEPTEFEDELLQTIAEAIHNQRDAKRWVPIVLRGKADYLDKIRFISLFQGETAENRAALEALLKRFEVSYSLPFGLISGMKDSKFWNAQIIAAGLWPHVEPVSDVALSGMTDAVYQPLLVAAGMSAAEAATNVIWRDPSEIVVQPDKSASATEGYDRGIIGGKAWRREHGYPEEDAPDPAELEQMWLWKARITERIQPGGQPTIPGGTPDVAPVGTRDIAPPPAPGGPASPNGRPPAAGPGRTPPARAPRPGMSARWDPVRRPGTEVIVSRPVTAAAGRTRRYEALARKLRGIDQSVMTRLATLADAKLHEAVRRAGARIRTVTRGKKLTSAALDAVRDNLFVPRTAGPEWIRRLSLDEAKLLEGAAADYDAIGRKWLAAAQKAALDAVAAETGQDREDLYAATEADRRDGLSAADTALLAGFAVAAHAFLYNPHPSATTAAEGEVSDLAAPRASIRQALDLAGGASPDARGSLGIAGGPLVSGALDSGGVVSLGWVWDYGSEIRDPFPPHEDLDGTEFSDWEDGQLVNDLSFPGTDYFYPGDHSGCACGVLPLLADAAEAEGEGVLVPEEAMAE